MFYSLKFIYFLISFTGLVEVLNAATIGEYPDEPYADVSGIYYAPGHFTQYLMLGVSLEYPPAYITINRNNDQYVLINFTKNLDFLWALSLITKDELITQSISPSIEEFSFTFNANEWLPAGGALYGIQPIVRSPRTTSMTQEEMDGKLGRYILFFTKNGQQHFCISTNTSSLLIPDLCYNKLF